MHFCLIDISHTLLIGSLLLRDHNIPALISHLRSYIYIKQHLKRKGSKGMLLTHYLTCRIFYL